MEIFQKNPLQIENSGKKSKKSKNSEKIEKIEKSTLLRISIKKLKKSRPEKKVGKNENHGFFDIFLLSTNAVVSDAR